MRPSGPPPSRRGLQTASAAAVAALSLCVGVAGALAQGGGITPPSPPEAGDVVCIATCAGVREATTASKVQISGHHLGHVSEVRFNSRQGGRIGVQPASATSRTVTAKVPDEAATGRPKVSDPYENGSTSRKKLRIVPADQIPDSGNFKLKKAAVKARRTYYYGVRRPKVTYMFTNSRPADVRIDVVRRKDGTVVDSWTQRAQEPNTVHSASWNGRIQGTRKPARNGGYRFRIGPESGTMDTTSKARFAYHQFEFPVRGSHGYGDGVGAPRAGHTHQGQDVPARCGTKLVAARGGRVQWRAYDSGGGNYVVIDGKRTSHDYVYMHLRKPSPLHRGERVKTGEKVGAVGDTGDATGCHLHFEEWSGPGWYEGGHFLKSVTRHLKQWDAWS
jgi:murein DD-endopeptidase MepM/ murein hydrolase activator NlpD